MSWRGITDWAKQRPSMLRLADRLGRGQGRLRVLDRLSGAPRAAHRPTLAGWAQRELSAVWLGHATVLLRIAGRTVLTDPVFSNRVGIGLALATVGPRRLIAPPLPIDALPPIDLILISHAHFDHLDRPTLVRLPRRTPVITARQTGDLISDLGFRQVRELDWDEHVDLPGTQPLRVSAHRVAHWGARTFSDRHRGYNAYLLDAGKRRVLYGGDTAFHHGFDQLGPVDLAILGIGAYDPYIAAHASPEQAWQMARAMDAEYVLPMHHTTFRLSYEPMDEPLRRLLLAAGDRAERVVARSVGQEWTLPMQ